MSTLTLLKDVSTITLDGSGNGTAVNSPNVAEYWQPMMVAVGCNTTLTPVPHATVYHGSPGVPVNQGQYIDDTFLGSGDTSSVISGTSIQYGEAVITVFENGTPGAVVTVVVYGQTSDVPSNLSLPPQVPGTRFSGHPTTEVVTLNAVVNIGTPVILNAAQTLVLNTGQTSFAGYTDVRQYGAYDLKVFARAVGGVATAPVSILMQASWVTSPTSNDQMYQDTQEFWADGAGPTFNAALGSAYFQDVQHGPYGRWRITNQSVDAVELSYTLVFSTRIPPSHLFRQNSGVNGILVTTQAIIGAGANADILCPILYGRGFIRFGNIGANAVIYGFLYGSFPLVAEQITVAPGAVDRREIILPKNALRINIFSAAGTTYTINAISQFDKTG